jgi:hypothetical protein
MLGRSSRRVGVMTAVMLLCCLGLVTGCGGSPAPVKQPDLLGAIPQKPDPGVRDAFRGLYALLPFPGEAMGTLAGRCMVRQGFRPMESVPTSTPDPFGWVYGLTVAEAKRSGYRFGHPPPQTPPLPYSANDAQAWLAAYLGPDNGPMVTVPNPLFGGTMKVTGTGCLAEARAAVYGDLTTWASLEFFTSNVVSTALNQASKSTEMRALNQAWSSCMTAKGFPGLNIPDEPLAKARVDWTEGNVAVASPQEKATALADAQCEVDTDYAATRTFVEDRYLTAALVKFESTLTAAREMYSAAEVRAREALKAS